MKLAAFSCMLHGLFGMFLGLFGTMTRFVVMTVTVKFGGVVMLLRSHLMAIGGTRMSVRHDRGRI
jgi:hypothetical protein